MNRQTIPLATAQSEVCTRTVRKCRQGMGGLTLGDSAALAVFARWPLGGAGSARFPSLRLVWVWLLPDFTEKTSACQSCWH